MSDDERFNTTKAQLRLREDAGRFELGYPNVSGIYALGLVAEHYLALGAKEIEERVLSLAEFAAREGAKLPGATVRGFYPRRENRSAIVTLVLDGRYEPDAVALRKKGIAVPVRRTEEGAELRLSLHYYNTKEDISRLLEALKTCVKNES